MQGKDILKQPVGTNWAVVKRHSWVRKENKSSGNVDRKNCEEVSLIRSEYYRRTDHVRDTLDSNIFRVAESGERSKGFLTINAQGHYRVIPASDFIGVWKDLDASWTINETLREEANRVELERKEKRERAELSLRASVSDVQENIERSISTLLGSTAIREVYVKVDSEWDETLNNYTPRLGGRVQLSLADFQRLLEVVYEAQDSLA